VLVDADAGFELTISRRELPERDARIAQTA